MAVNLTGGIDYTQWKPVTAGGFDASGIKVENPKATKVENDAFVSSTGETCTDGKDDGKIGFWGAIGNAIKGVGKSIVNGVKGMFTNKEGKFSLGKTLLSIGTIALCIAVPAVGVAACCVGAAAGAVQVGKGIYNASKAETDAEAKQAWQDIGGGTFTVAASVVGAKAGVKGMSSAAAKGSGTSALQGLKGTKFTAKTAGQYAKAFKTDAIASTKYNMGQIKNTASTYYAQAKNANIGQTLKSKAGEAYGTAKTGYGKAKQVVTENSGKIMDGIKHPVQTAKNLWTSAKGKVTKENANAIWNGIKGAGKTAGEKLKGLNLKGKAGQILNDLKSGKATFEQAVSKYGYDDVAQVLQYTGGVVFSDTVI